MDDFTYFMACYTNGDYKRAATFIFKHIVDNYHKATDLPLSLLDYIAEIVQDLDKLDNGLSLVPNDEQEFQIMCGSIYRRIIEGPGNPTVNN